MEDPFHMDQLIDHRQINPLLEGNLSSRDMHKTGDITSLLRTKKAEWGKNRRETGVTEASRIEEQAQELQRLECGQAW